jgi:hypothetical protein
MKRMDTLAAAAACPVAVGNQELAGHLAKATFYQQLCQSEVCM